jgi:hypothetical protein
MSDGGLLNSTAWIEGLRDNLRAPTTMSTIVLLTPRETAEQILRCSERTLERRRLVGDGPPFVKIGASIRYPLNELERWLADNTRRSTSEPAAPTGRKLRRKAPELNAQK